MHGERYGTPQELRAKQELETKAKYKKEAAKAGEKK